MSESIIDQFKEAVIAKFIDNTKKHMLQYPNHRDEFKQYLINPTFNTAYDKEEYTSEFPTSDGQIFTRVSEEGGGEGDGSYVGHVYQLGDQFVLVTGHYTSWDGTDWDYGSINEVFPRQVTRTEYFFTEEA